MAQTNQSVQAVAPTTDPALTNGTASLAELGATPAPSPDQVVETRAIPAKRGRPTVVVVGAGFGGLSIANTLTNTEVDVLMLDRHNFHGFWPLLYQVATAGLEPESIAFPVRAIFRKAKNFDFKLTEVLEPHFDQKVLETSVGPISYDYLVLAAGSTNNFFGNENLAMNTHGLKDLEEAVELRNRVLSAFERAATESDPAKRVALLTFVIVGGGPTGVELAGAFSELIHIVLRKDYPMLNVKEARIILIESSPHLLSAFPESLQHQAFKQLKKLGVEVNLKTAVMGVEQDQVHLRDGSQIAAHTVIWAAGVRAADLADKLGVPLQRGARVPVEPTLNLADHPEVFIIGDMAYLPTYKHDQAYPMVAQVAIQMGKLAASNILAQLKNKPQRPFKYTDKGTLATIGRASAVMDAYGIKLSGFLAWIAWLVIHLFYLVGFRNRLIVLTNWAYNYFTYERGSRIITGDPQGH